MPYRKMNPVVLYEVDDGDDLIEFVSEKTARDRFNQMRDKLDTLVPNLVEGGEPSMYSPEYLSLTKTVYLESVERIDVHSDD